MILSLLWKMKLLYIFLYTKLKEYNINFIVIIKILKYSLAFKWLNISWTVNITY